MWKISVMWLINMLSSARIGTMAQQMKNPFLCVWEQATFVTHSDKRGTKSLRRSRANWRKHQLGVISSIYYLWLFTFQGDYSVTFLLRTAHLDRYMTFTHISNDKSLLGLKQSAPCSRDGASTVTLLAEAITPLWCYAQFWNLSN